VFQSNTRYKSRGCPGYRCIALCCAYVKRRDEKCLICAQIAQFRRTEQASAFLVSDSCHNSRFFYWHTSSTHDPLQQFTPELQTIPRGRQLNAYAGVGATTLLTMGAAIPAAAATIAIFLIR
jgi:hypothetical protein